MKDIAVPSFVNYTDLRKKETISAIEIESIQNYARGLSEEQMKILLAEIPYQVLMEECSRKFYALEHENKGVRRLLGMWGTDYGKQQFSKDCRKDCKWFSV